MSVKADKVVELITDAFRGVTRKDGVSLHQASVLDEFGTKEEFAEAKKLDVDESWLDVPIGLLEKLQVFPHLDKVGFRYYLPAYMVWMIQNCKSSRSFSKDALIYALIRRSLDDPMVEKYEFLDVSQKRAVAIFLKFCESECAGFVDAKAAVDALHSYWREWC